MTGIGHVFVWLLILSVFAAIADSMSGPIYGHKCVECGGWGAHKRGCPRRRRR